MVDVVVVDVVGSVVVDVAGGSDPRSVVVVGCCVVTAVGLYVTGDPVVSEVVDVVGLVGVVGVGPDVVVLGG